MNTLYIAWQDHHSRNWFPVGRLVRHKSKPAEYEFAYVHGAIQAKQTAGFLMIPGFPKLDRLYRAPTIFPAFSNRVMNLKRPDRPEYLSQLGIDINNWDEVTELSVSGGRVHSDSFEAFPEITPDEVGHFATRFTLHGLRHTNHDSMRRAESLEVGESLELAFELNNPVAKHAISVKTCDQYVLGWLPHYLVSGMHRDNAWMVTEVETKVAQVNHDSPLSHRLLVDFSGRLPEGFNPMRDLPEYQLVATEAGRPQGL